MQVHIFFSSKGFCVLSKSSVQYPRTPLLRMLHIRSCFGFAAMVVANPPEEVRRALASSHNTIALLLLLLLHFVVTHIMGLACVILGTAAIVGLDRRLRSNADAQVRPSPWNPP